MEKFWNDLNGRKKEIALDPFIRSESKLKRGLRYIQNFFFEELYPLSHLSV